MFSQFLIRLHHFSSFLSVKRALARDLPKNMHKAKNKSPQNRKSFQINFASEKDADRLVAGEFVCPNRNLLENPGVYFESDTETMEYEVCEAPDCINLR